MTDSQPQPDPFCPRCDAETRASDRYCARCGTRLETDPPAEDSQQAPRLEDGETASAAWPMLLAGAALTAVGIAFVFMRDEGVGALFSITGVGLFFFALFLAALESGSRGRMIP